MRRALVVVVAAAAAVACGQADAGRQDVQAVATVLPLAWIAQEVAPDADLLALGGQGSEPHDLELGPRDRAALESADVVVHLGAVGFQPQVEAAAGDASGQVVDVLEVVGQDAFLPATRPDAMLAGGGPLDPHIWFDPAVMARIASAVGSAFADVDPGSIADYAERADAVAAQLHALDAELDVLLSDCGRREVIVSHEAYGYLLAPRGLRQVGIAGQAPEAGSSPAVLADLAARISEAGLPAVLAEPVEGRADAEALAREAGVDLLDIDPLEAVSPERLETGYPQLLRAQAETFASVLGCREGQP